MKRLAWVTDIHFDFVSAKTIDAFSRRVLDEAPDGVLIGGDISEAYSVEGHLILLKDLLQLPIFFVLGNHDFYRGSIAAVRQKVGKLAERFPELVWLTRSEFVSLSDTTALVGHDSWADGRLGKGVESELMVNDYFFIWDFIGLPVKQRFDKLGLLGDEAAGHFARVLPRAFEQHRKLILLTHAPPFQESCWHEGRISDGDGLPHFACKAVGEVLRREMERRPECELLVLCGHTHSPGTAQILPNLLVRTGAAVYGNPTLQSIVKIE